ncbi:hypothetical protein C1645_871834 [Glomus cerebriforme]|uniref:Galactose oxidase n=1 Tax=Glomus cerebriforme TaxID=658196 RepID=A0A397TJU0_9GLOM|nr:hypothetical protein C1645_871834 [Glomus cerebriforme]
MTPFKPQKRTYHTATVIDNKLYILDGDDVNGNIIGKEFFYLDFSVSFNTQNLLWKDLSSIDTVPPHDSAASVKGGANNSTLFLYGGYATDKTMALVYTYDPQSSTWSTPIITGIKTLKKQSLTGIMNNNGKMYLWGGYDTNGNNKNDMLILDTINLSWGQGSLVGAPSARYDYGAVLLPNNNIIYTGGWDDNAELTLSQVYIYDIINDNWIMRASSGKIPSGRDSFSTVLGLDGQSIIIFGGTATATNDNLTPEDSLYVLNLNNFEWYIPTISGQIPKSRMFHKANVIANYMVVSFGDGYDQSTESDILLLDISNSEEYMWTNNFVPTIISPPSSSASPSPTQSSISPINSVNSLSTQQPEKFSSSIVGAILGSLFGGIGFTICCFFLYKWNKNRQKQKNAMLISGNENRENMLISNERNSYNSRQSNLVPINNDYYNHGQEIPQIPPRNEYMNNHESIMIPAPAPVYNYGQERIPIANNERFSSQNPYDNLKNEFRQEIQNLRQEFILQNNGQASAFNATRNSNNNSNY